MRTILISFVALTLVGCGSFTLGVVHPEQAQTVRERDADMLYCRDAASLAAHTTERNIATAVAKGTLIGAPFAIAEDRRKQREVFAVCMSERGYRVVPA